MGNLQVVRFLVDKAGADVNWTNKYGSTALYGASKV